MIDIITGFKSNSRETLDKRHGPYASTTDALAALGTNNRFVGLKVIIVENAGYDPAGNFTSGDFKKYVFDGGIADGDLVVDEGGISDAPSDSSAYGRIDGAWTKVLPLTGGELTGTLDLPKLNYINSFTNGDIDISVYQRTNNNAALKYRFGGDETIDGLAICDYDSEAVFLHRDGYVTVTKAPTEPDELTRKDYVDTKLPLAGGTITGDMTVQGTLSLDHHLVTAGITFPNVDGISTVIDYDNGALNRNQIIFYSKESTSENYIRLVIKDYADQNLIVNDLKLTNVADELLLNGKAVALRDDVNTKLPLAGGTMTGNIDMAGNSILFTDGTYYTINLKAYQNSLILEHNGTTFLQVDTAGSHGNSILLDYNGDLQLGTANVVAGSFNGAVVKSDGVATEYLDGTGNYSTPAKNANINSSSITSTSNLGTSLTRAEIDALIPSPIQGELYGIQDSNNHSFLVIYDGTDFWYERFAKAN
jgi:hypothetical protein